jgi:Helix-turn-helix domain
MIDVLGMQRVVWRSARATTEKIVLLAIADFYSDCSPEPWPSVPTLAERCSLGRTAVLEAIAALERDGVLVVRRVPGRPDRYDLSHVTPVLGRMATPKVATTHDSGPEHAVARLVMETLQWDDDANQSATQTSPPDRRDQSVGRTGPVRGRDQSAWRTRRIQRRIQRRKPLLRMPSPANSSRSNCPLPSAPSSCSRSRGKPNGCGRSIGKKHEESQKRLARPLVVTARCPKLRAIRACAQSSCCLLLDTQWQTSSGSPRTCQSKLGGAVETACAALVACPSKSFREHLPSAMRGRDRSRRHAATEAVRKEGFIENTLLENAEAGRYGAEIRRAALSTPNLKQLADELEQREADGDLHLTRLADAPSLDGLMKGLSLSLPRSQGRSA